ncbi:hypothetical protein T4D_16917 [Trichinella pseudospiralis]|uniref:Uncharacterized protein n=1 Tax=Trichinella pseudospiralis TaxID=6337 RepID=A0A0V1FZH5_TRIPS|nr:hypothetical protein T4D_16917 [Trichinella pseudospiralis]
MQYQIGARSWLILKDIVSNTTVNGFCEVFSFADLELEYHKSVENSEQTSPYEAVPLADY